MRFFSAKPRVRRQFVPTVNDARLPVLALPSVGPNPIDPANPTGEVEKMDQAAIDLGFHDIRALAV